MKKLIFSLLCSCLGIGFLFARTKELNKSITRYIDVFGTIDGETIGQHADIFFAFISPHIQFALEEDEDLLDQWVPLISKRIGIDKRTVRERLFEEDFDLEEVMRRGLASFAEVYGFMPSENSVHQVMMGGISLDAHHYDHLLAHIVRDVEKFLKKDEVSVVFDIAEVVTGVSRARINLALRAIKGGLLLVDGCIDYSCKHCCALI